MYALCVCVSARIIENNVNSSPAMLAKWHSHTNSIYATHKKNMTNKQNHNHHIFCTIKSLRRTKSDAQSNVCQRFFFSSFYIASCACVCMLSVD